MNEQIKPPKLKAGARLGIVNPAYWLDEERLQRAVNVFEKLGYEVVLVNSNPATIMTDPGMADATYIEPLNVKMITEIIDKERPDALLPNLCLLYTSPSPRD